MRTRYAVLILSWLLLFSLSCKQTIRENDASGTIGQVKKYRKEQMTEKDILLRSEVMKDTTRLDEIIQGLVVFNAYSSTLATSLDNRLADLETLRGSDTELDQFITGLADFRDFLRNNNAVLTNTILMLADFHHDTISESSADVESNLRAFVNYIQQLEQKDSILTATVNHLDKYIGENEPTVVSTSQIDQLKSIRDELLIRVIQQSYMLNDPEDLQSIDEKKVYDINNLQACYDVEKMKEEHPQTDAISGGTMASFLYEEDNPDSTATDLTSNIAHGVQSYVLSDNSFLNELDQLRDISGLSGYVDAVSDFIIVGSSSSLDRVRDNVSLSNVDFIGSAILNSQDFIKQTEGLGIDITEPK